MKKLGILTGVFAVFFICCGNVTAENSVHEYRKRASHKALEVTQGDIESEIRFGKEVSARILGNYRLYDDEKATRYVNLVGKGLASYSSRPEIEFRFAIIDTDMINAFAAPGGYIFITKGTLKMIDNEAQLAGVIAHEIAHVTEKHIVKELNIKGYDDSPLAGLSSLLGGGSSETVRTAFIQMADKAQEILFEKGLKKKDELDSDRMAAMLLAHVGYDPLAYREFLQKIKDSEEGKESIKLISSTHPPLEQRLQSLDKTIDEEGLKGIKSSDTNKRYNEYVRF